MRLRRREESMTERFLQPAPVQPQTREHDLPEPARIILGGLRRLVVMTVGAGGICLGLGLLFAELRGGDRWHDVAVVYYVIGAVAALAALGGRGTARAYGDYSVDSVRALNEAKARNLVLAAILIGLGVLVDVLAR